MLRDGAWLRELAVRQPGRPDGVFGGIQPGAGTRRKMCMLCTSAGGSECVLRTGGRGDFCPKRGEMPRSMVYALELRARARRGRRMACYHLAERHQLLGVPPATGTVGALALEGRVMARSMHFVSSRRCAARCRPGPLVHRVVIHHRDTCHAEVSPAGNHTVNTEPRPGSLDTSIHPRWSATIP